MKLSNLNKIFLFNHYFEFQFKFNRWEETIDIGKIIKQMIKLLIKKLMIKNWKSISN